MTDNALALTPQVVPSNVSIPDMRTTDSILKIAELAAKSGLCKTHNTYDAFFVIGYGMELGIPPMTALRTIHIINNVPTCSGEVMLALIRRSGKVTIRIEGDAQSATVHMQRKDTGDEYQTVWTMQRATNAGITGKDPWKKFAQQMLKWRAVSECAKFLCSDIIGGLYTVEEINPDMAVNEDGEPLDITVTPVPDKVVTPNFQPPTATTPPHWSDDPQKIKWLVDAARTTGYIEPGQGAADLLQLLNQPNWRSYPTGKAASEAIKAAGAALQTPPEPTQAAPAGANPFDQISSGTSTTKQFHYANKRLVFQLDDGQTATWFKGRAALDQLLKLSAYTFANVAEGDHVLPLTLHIQWQDKAGANGRYREVTGVTADQNDIDAWLAAAQPAQPTPSAQPAKHIPEPGDDDIPF